MRRMRGRGGCCVVESWIFTSVHHKAVQVESKAPVAHCNPPSSMAHIGMEYM